MTDGNTNPKDNPTVEQIVKSWLEANGYDGLYGDGCGCSVDNLAPCCEGVGDCHAGYHRQCETCNNWFTGPDKDEVKCPDCALDVTP